MAWAGSRARRRPAASSTHEPQPGHPRVRAQVRGARADRRGRRHLRPQSQGRGPGGLRALAQPHPRGGRQGHGPSVRRRDLSSFKDVQRTCNAVPSQGSAFTSSVQTFRMALLLQRPIRIVRRCRLACFLCRHPLSSKFGAPAVVAKRQARDGGQHTLCPAARGRSHVLGTRQPSPRDGGSDGGRLLLRQWRHLQRHSEQDCNRCGSSSNHTSTLAYAGRARGASSEAVRRNPTLPVHALLQARSARHGRSTSPSPRRTRWAACRPSARRRR